MENPNRKRKRWRWVSLGAGFVLLVVGFLFPSRARPPMPLGVVDGQLAHLPDTPNAVSSQAPPDAEGYMDPLPWNGNPSEAIATLKDVVESFPRTTIVTTRSDYMHVKFRSRWVGFVDDVEFYVPQDSGVIHFRSASRLGYSDLGVNEERMTEFGKRLADQRR